jgi:hypothetical protein
MTPRFMTVLLSLCVQSAIHAEALTSARDLRFDSSNDAGFSTTSGELKILSAGPHGASCLSVSCSCPGEIRVSKKLSFEGRQFSECALELFVPDDAPFGFQVSLFFTDKDGLWFQASSDQRPKRGMWQTLLFDISPSSPNVTGLHHEAAWNHYYMNRTAVVGMQFFCSEAWKGSVLIQSLTYSDHSPNASPLKIEHLRLPVSAVHVFETLEFNFDIPRAISNPFNPDEICVDAIFTAPSGSTARVPCFYYQPFRRELDDHQTEIVIPSGRAGWCLRYTPLESGTYQWKLSLTVGKQNLITKEQTLAVEPGKQSGFVRVSKKDPHYFETADGTFFYPVGQNIHAPFDKRCAEMLRVPVLANRGTFAYDDYFKKMAANGENAVVVWMCNWWLSIEWTAKWKGFGGLTDFNLGNAWRLDQLLDSARKHGIFVHLVLDNHGKLSKFVDPEWADNPYNSVLGGPCTQPEEFFTSPAAFEIYKKRLRYIVARWGNNPNLFGFELMGEFNLVGSDRQFKGSPEQALWCQRACAYLKEIDCNHHIVTVHYSNDFTTVDPKVASLNGIDYLVGDVYKAGGSVVPLMLQTAEENSRFGKPTFSTEFGGNWNGTTPARLHADLHAGLWSNAMTVSAAAPFFWWFDYIDRFGLYTEYQSLANYTKGEDRRGSDLKTVAISVKENGKESEGVRALVLMNKERASFWAYDVLDSEIMPEGGFARSHSELSVCVDGLTPGSYSLEFWDTFKGIIVDRKVITVGSGTTEVKLPEFKIDIAGKISPVKDAR